MFQHFLAAKGLHASVKHLETLAPVTKSYRSLKANFRKFSGSSWQGSTHSKPSTDSHILKMLRRGKDANIFTHVEGRDSEAKPIVDILSMGGDKLQSTGLQRFQSKYKKWRAGMAELNDEEDELPEICISYKGTSESDDEEEDEEDEAN